MLITFYIKVSELKFVSVRLRSFSLANPVSDLVYPDCLEVEQKSQKDRAIYYEGSGNHFFKIQIRLWTWMVDRSDRNLVCP